MCKFLLRLEGQGVLLIVCLSLALPLMVSCMLLKMESATNISHWLNVHSRWFKNYIFGKKCILISFWIFQYCFYHSFTLYYCAIFDSLITVFSIPSGCQTVWIQIRPNILAGLIWVQTVCKGYQQTTKVAPSRQKVIYKATS